MKIAAYTASRSNQLESNNLPTTSPDKTKNREIMKNAVKVSLAFLFLQCLLTGCANAQTPDLSTDKAVREVLAKTGGFKSMDNLCIERMKESAKIIIIGNYANDRDCRIDGAFIDSRYLAETDADFSKSSLAALGWKAANRKRREQLAKLWIEKGLLAFYTVLYTKDKDFGGEDFQPPTVSASENGETVVSMWVSFTTRKKEFKHFEYRFAKDGNLLENSTNSNDRNISNQDRPKIEAASNLDLSTDEAVIAELQKMKDAENAALVGEDEAVIAKRRAVRLKAKNVCIERFKESAKVIVIGSFRHDYGCYFAGAFVNSRFYEKTEIELHKNALAAFGWEKANQTEREKLAGFWVEKGLLAFFTVLQTKPKELENFDVRPPRVSTTEKGEIKITLWIQLPPRMRREKGFQQLEYRFAKDGNFMSGTTLDAVIANYKEKI